MSCLNQALRAALDQRQDLLAELHAQGTDCYRLFHGSQEGIGGLTIDRYGPQLLVQSFHQSLDREALLSAHETVNQALGLNTLLVYNDRSRGNSRIDREDSIYRAEEDALADLVGHEWGLNYRVRGRHAGQDPLLFLDLRNARGWVKATSRWAGRTASSIRNCRPCSSSSPTISRPSANWPDYRLPSAGARSCRAIHVWNSASTTWCCSTLRPGPRAPSVRSICCAIISDLLRDYQSLLKPALLTTADNGVLICCNNLAKVGMDDWREQVLRCAEKAGRPVRDWQVLKPAGDFPSQDGQPPLKTLILQL